MVRDVICLYLVSLLFRGWRRLLVKLLFLNMCCFLPGFPVYSGFSVVPELRATPVSCHSQDISLSKGQWGIFQVARGRGNRTQPGDFLL